MSNKKNSNNKYKDTLNKSAYSIANWYLIFLLSVIFAPLVLISTLIMLFKNTKEYIKNKKKYKSVNIKVEEL